MSQSLSQVAAQLIRQEQRLTPQLIQSMDILQLPLMALETRINQELERNPVLEYEPPQPEPLPETEQEPSNTDPADLESLFLVLSQRYASDLPDRPGDTRWRHEQRDAKMDAMANTASRPVSLHEYLLQQWSFVDAPRQVKRAGQIIINHLEDDGYLRTDLQQIAESLSPPLRQDVLEQALKLIQQLDPPGVGARDLRQCLLIQLASRPGDNSLAQTLVRNHLADIEKNRYPAIARATGKSIDQIKQAVQLISKLHPRPGLLVVDRQVPRIVPDVIVEYADDGDGYTVRLARGNWPRLRISPLYRRMLQQIRDDKPARDFIRRNVEAATAIIDAIRYRRDRLLQVAKAIVAKQRDFLDYGPQHLKVLRMSDLAAELGCDPSTISRTVDEKYMQTPRGIYPLRCFFTGGTETAEGRSLSWDAVKAKVKQIIDSEDKAKPLSDDQVVAELKKACNIDVSRRTIAKYRAQLRIPPAWKRKQY
ncbi:MAG: RNA polymerase factor sigma-54 [Phycisphaerae bacterium]